MQTLTLRPGFTLALAATLLSASAQASDLMAAGRGIVLASTPGANERMGEEIAIHGDWAVVGVETDSGPGYGSGTAYVYKRIGNGWSSYQELIPSILEPGDAFGHSVAIHEDILVIGAYGSDFTHGFAGVAIVFALDPQTQVWEEVAILQDPEVLYGDANGSGVALNETFIAVGSSADDGGKTNSGSVGFWVRDEMGTGDPTDDSWTHSQKLHAMPEVTSGQFGMAMDMDGSRLIVGAPQESTTKSGAGTAYLLEFNGSAWVQTQKFLDPQPNSSAYFGDDVAIDGDTIVIGSPGKDVVFADQGAAFVFEYQFGQFVQTGLLLSPTGEEADNFGSDLDISDGAICVGAARTDALGLTDSGAAHLFGESDWGWEQEDRFWATVPESSGWFGAGVAMDAGQILVGATRSDLGGSSAGAVFAYALGTGSFTRFGACDGSGSAAPCGNESESGADEGCLNSSGRGGSLSASGSDDAAADDISISATGLIPFQPALLFTGTDSYSAGLPFGDGLRVATGSNVRRGVALPDAYGLAIWGPGLGAATTGWQAGTTLTFQAWYRDPGGSPCGSGFNFTSGLLVDFE